MELHLLEDASAPAAAEATSADASFTATERVVAAVWSAALGLDYISPDDNFFAIGGDSLAALRLTRQLWLEWVPRGSDGLDEATDEYGVISSALSPAALFNSPVLRHFAAAIDRSGIKLTAQPCPAAAVADTHTQSYQLRRAAAVGNIDAILGLLANKADPNGGVYKSSPGVAPLHLAHSCEVVTTLVAAKAQLTIVTPGGVLPVHLAAAHGRIEALDQMLQCGSPILAQDRNSQKPLHYAA